MIVSRQSHKPIYYYHFSTIISRALNSPSSTSPSPSPSPSPSTQISKFDEIPTIDRLTKLINDHPFPSNSFLSHLRRHIPSTLLSSSLVNSVLGRLFSGHANASKALEFFKFSLQFPTLLPSHNAFEKILLILTRARAFDTTWEVMKETHQKHPLLITHKSLCIFLSKYAKFRSFEDTLQMFDEMERLFSKGKFGVDEFNVLLRAFCTQRQMKEAQTVFRKYHSKFKPDTKTFNILLLGFKESGNVTAVELFYHEMVRRGFKPNAVTYNIRIDTYCKKGCFLDALRVKEEMEKSNFLPTLETMTTLVHGACIARNPLRAKRIFDEISERRLELDTSAYNALLCTYVRSRDLKSGMELMDEMEEKSIGCDDVTYHTLFWGTNKFGGVEGVCKIYKRMVEKNFVPKMRTVVMLMKFFCENGRCDMGLDLWEYLAGKGCCPHGHSLDLLVTGLCCKGRVEEAYKCFKQVVERGRRPSKEGFQVLEGFLVKAGEKEKLRRLKQMMKRLKTSLPLSSDDGVVFSADLTLN